MYVTLWAVTNIIAVYSEPIIVTNFLRTKRAMKRSRGTAGSLEVGLVCLLLSHHALYDGYVIRRN